MGSLNKNHLVWDVYDNYRTARLNVKYYCARLHKLERWNFIIEVIIAITAPSSAFSGLWFLKTQTGLIIWQIASSIAAVAAFIKPFLKLGQKIKFYEQTISGYRALEQDIYELILKIREEQIYSDESKKMFDLAIKKKKILATNPPENIENKKLIQKYYNEVNEEIPNHSFYIPEGV